MPTTSATPQDADPSVPASPKRRDVARTRDRLLEAARRRFADSGYAATTVREIAEDAGVNVALINRYFTNKAGLFEACLAAAVAELAQVGNVATVSEIPEALARRLIGADDRRQQILPLLLRSSGDKRADEVRVAVFRTFSERIASVGGWRPDEPDQDELLLRGQFILASVVGLAVMRSLPGFDPLAVAGAGDLTPLLLALVDSALPGPVTPIEEE